MYHMLNNFFLSFGRIQLLVPNWNGVEEKVILCTTVWTNKSRMREAYTNSEFEWMVVEVNHLWRRKHTTFNMKSKRIHSSTAFVIKIWLTNQSLHGIGSRTSVLCMTMRRMGH